MIRPGLISNISLCESHEMKRAPRIRGDVSTSFAFPKYSCLRKIVRIKMQTQTGPKDLSRRLVSAQYCVIDAVSSHDRSTCQYVQSAGSERTLSQCVMTKTAPSPLMRSRPHLMTPKSPRTTLNTFQRKSGTLTKNSRISFDGLKNMEYNLRKTPVHMLA